MVTVEAAQIAAIPTARATRCRRARRRGRSQRHHADPYESVCQARRASVELVAIDGRLLYGRDDWFRLLAPNAPSSQSPEPARDRRARLGLGEQMRLDIATPADPIANHPALPGLAATRAQLLARYAEGPVPSWPNSGLPSALDDGRGAHTVKVASPRPRFNYRLVLPQPPSGVLTMPVLSRQPGGPSVRALGRSRCALERGRRVARVGREPSCVASSRAASRSGRAGGPRGRS